MENLNDAVSIVVSILGFLGSVVILTWKLSEMHHKLDKRLTIIETLLKNHSNVIEITSAKEIKKQN